MLPAPGAALQVPDIMGTAVVKPWVFRRDILGEGSFLGLWVAGSQCIQHSHAAVSWVVPGGWAVSRALERAFCASKRALPWQWQKALPFWGVWGTA